MMQSISGTLKSDLSTKYSQTGDPVEIEVTKDARRLYFEALFVDYMRLFGTVTLVRPASKTQPAALAIRVTEAGSKKGTITLNGILGNPVVVKHKYMWLPNSVAISGGESHYSFNGVQPDPRFGSALNSKYDLFLEKGQAELEIVLFRGRSCFNRAITPTIRSCSNWDFSNPSINRTDTWLNRAVSANRLINQRSPGASALVCSCNVLRNQRVDSNPPENFRNPWSLWPATCNCRTSIHSEKEKTNQ